MDRIEYIKGDLVVIKAEPNNFRNGIVCKFDKYTNENEALLNKANGIVRFLVKREWIAPIPLTPEILKKNGWNRTKRFLPTYRKGYLTCVCRVVESLQKPGIFSVWYGRCEYFLRHVMYVHELQHVLFGLGLNHEMEV